MPCSLLLTGSRRRSRPGTRDGALPTGQCRASPPACPSAETQGHSKKNHLRRIRQAFQIMCPSRKAFPSDPVAGPTPGWIGKVTATIVALVQETPVDSSRPPGTILDVLPRSLGPLLSPRVVRNRVRPVAPLDFSTWSRWGSGGVQVQGGVSSSL